MNIIKAALQLTCAAAVSIASAQQAPAGAQKQQAPAPGNGNGGFFSGLTRNYRSRYEAPVNFGNSNRIEQLLRAGNIYLSLQDAIAVALENNLDIESQRYNKRITQADLMRAEAGTLLMGTSTGVTRGPSGALSGGSGALAAASLVSGGGGGGGSTTGGSFGGLTIQQIGTSIPNLDPVFNANVGWFHQTQPVTARGFLQAASNYVVTNSGSTGMQFSKSWLTGTYMRVNYDNARSNQALLSNDINPSRQGDLGIVISQPLLQGFGIALNSRNIRIAKNNIRINSLTFKNQVMATVSSVINLYWDMVSYREDAKVKRQALELAEKLYNDNKKQVEIGTLAPIEIVKAEAEVAARQADLTNSESLVTQQETILKNYISKNGLASPSLAEAHIIPTDHIDIPKSEAVEPLQDMIGQAMSKRPEIQQSEINLENSKLTLNGVKNALKPQLSVYATATNNALAGDVNSMPIYDDKGNLIARQVDPFFIGGYGTILSQLFRRNFPNYGAGFQLNIPLRNRSAQGNLIQGQLQLRQQEIQNRKLNNQIMVDVRNAVTALQQARARYESAAKARILQEQSLDAEQKKYALGASTVFLVIQAQRDLATAKGTEVATLSAYAKAKANLDDSIGRTLEVNNVSVDEAYEGKVSRAPSAIPAVDPQQ